MLFRSGPLHELFGDFYEFLIDSADTVAERIVQLDGTAKAAPKGTSLQGTDKKLLSYVKQYSEFLAKQIKEGIVITSKTDQVSADILIEYGRELEKWIWKIESNLKEAE